MLIELNGTRHEVDDAATVASLIESAHGSTRGSAVVLDGVVVPRSAWAHTRLSPGQSIELITAVQGG